MTARPGPTPRPVDPFEDGAWAPGRLYAYREGPVRLVVRLEHATVEDGWAALTLTVCAAATPRRGTQTGWASPPLGRVLQVDRVRAPGCVLWTLWRLDAPTVEGACEEARKKGLLRHPRRWLHPASKARPCQSAITTGAFLGAPDR